MIGHNPLILIIVAEDHQIDKTHITVHKTDITGQIVKTISTEKITLDQNPMEITAEIIRKNAHI